MESILALSSHIVTNDESALFKSPLEEIGHAAFDIGRQVIAILDSMGGDADHEDSGDGGDAEPSLGAPENATGSQVV